MKKFFVAMVLIVMAFTAVAIGKTKITVDCPNQNCFIEINDLDEIDFNFETKQWVEKTLLDYILPTIEMEKFTETVSELDLIGPRCNIAVIKYDDYITIVSFIQCTGDENIVLWQKKLNTPPMPPPDSVIEGEVKFEEEAKDNSLLSKIWGWITLSI